jgi:hypothetical protein
MHWKYLILTMNEGLLIARREQTAGKTACTNTLDIGYTMYVIQHKSKYT